MTTGSLSLSVKKQVTRFLKKRRAGNPMDTCIADVRTWVWRDSWGSGRVCNERVGKLVLYGLSPLKGYVKRMKIIGLPEPIRVIGRDWRN